MSLNIVNDYAIAHKYIIHPNKSTVSVQYPGRKSKTVDVMVWHLDDNEIPTTDSFVHLGITRACSKPADTLIDDRISLARRTAYRLMGCGLHDNNGLDGATSIKIYQTYVFPRLLYG